MASNNPDNANPVVHKASSQKVRKLGDFLDEEEDSLFLSDEGGMGGGLTYSSDEVSSEEGALRRSDVEEELIDNLEVFGKVAPVTASTASEFL